LRSKQRDSVGAVSGDRLQVLRIGYLAGVLMAPLALCLWAAAGGAAVLRVDVLDRDGAPVNDVVIVATPRHAPDTPALTAPSHAVMDQIERQFVPRILVIRTGTPVDFPNSDNIAHQVYSFSPAKRFQLSLYRGRVYPPLVFDKAGLVVIGCNIHDNMLGYIYVTSSPYFGKTDIHGTLYLEGLVGGDYAVSAWSPRFNEPEDQILRDVQVAADANPLLTLRLTQPLSPEPRVKPAKAYRNEY
jgi:plastocyanin